MQTSKQAGEVPDTMYDDKIVPPVRQNEVFVPSTYYRQVSIAYIG